MSNWKVNNVSHKARKGGVHPITPTKEVKEVIEHDDVFYFWVESTLSIRAIDTDAEIRVCLLEKMPEEEADFYLEQRKKALSEGSSFKLVWFGERRLSNDEFADKVVKGISDRHKGYVCQMCGITFSSSTEFNQHKKKHFREYDREVIGDDGTKERNRRIGGLKR